jgi:hypothetical protein
MQKNALGDYEHNIIFNTYLSNISMYLILPATLCPGVHSAPNRNEYQKQENNVSGE